MRFRPQVQAVWVSLALLGSAVSGLAQENERYSGRLSPRPVDGRLLGQLTGVGEIGAVLEGSEVNIVGSFEGMQTPAVSASVRRGLDSGVAGPALADLEVTSGVSGLVYGSVRLNASQMESLEQGALYVQIDGANAEDGTLWGFLIRDRE